MTKPGKTRKTDKKPAGNYSLHKKPPKKTKRKTMKSKRKYAGGRGGGRGVIGRARHKETMKAVREAAREAAAAAKAAEEDEAAAAAAEDEEDTQPLLGHDNSKHPHPKAPVITTLVGGVAAVGVAAVGVLALVYISSNK